MTKPKPFSELKRISGPKYRDILTRYIKHIQDVRGHDFVNFVGKILTDEDVDLLNKLKQEILDANHH